MKVPSPPPPKKCWRRTRERTTFSPLSHQPSPRCSRATRGREKVPTKVSRFEKRLEDVFQTSADMETKMAEFEQCIQLVTESEDEFMLSLVKLYRTANPTASTEDINRAIKRKFLSGVSPDLRRSIFIFCTNPYATSVTYDALLEAARRAKLHIINPSNDS